MKHKSLLKVVAKALAGGTAAFAGYWFFLRPHHLRWGATDEEIGLPMPGDSIDPASVKLEATHAITINAPVSKVWQWLVQIGQNRGGFYSYTALENAVGCHMKNADQIVAEWQNLKIGDEIWLHPKAPPLPVTSIEPGKSLVLAKGWAFMLHPIDENTTRLIVKGKGEYNPDFQNAILNFLCWRVIFEPAHFIMERKMMLGIKTRAENAVGIARG